LSFPLVVILGMVAIVLLIMLESRRQVKKYGRGRGSATNIARAGLMEIQNLLEPDRKVEVLRDMERTQGLLVQLDEDGEPPRPGGAARSRDEASREPDRK